MINLLTRTEYSFNYAYGPLDKVIAVVGDEPAMGICDRAGTWGHVQFNKKMKAAGKKPIFGVELAVVPEPDRKEAEKGKRFENQQVAFFQFIARSDAGLRSIYELTTLASEQFYWQPRISYGQSFDITTDVIVVPGKNLLAGEVRKVWKVNRDKDRTFLPLVPDSYSYIQNIADGLGIRILAASNNFYPRPEDRKAYEIVARFTDRRTTPMHILRRWEWHNLFNRHDAVELTYDIAEECDAELPRAENVKFHSEQTLLELCEAAAPARGIDLSKKVYRDRMERELALITKKKFTDYFFVIYDLIQFAKKHMLVGPARGSSCGSLVCYLLSITEVDPIRFNLLFERFIDINRADLPDVDIDFPDDRRDLVFKYLGEKYGVDCVAKIGNVIRFKAKSTIGDVAKALHIPLNAVEDLKDSIIERSGGDSRANLCILDTFSNVHAGQTILKRYPELIVAADMENHAHYKGQHAAGIVITNQPIARFCSIDRRTGSIHGDKKDAEIINLLKIDVLGLRTLTVIQDVLKQIGWSNDEIVKYPLDDDDAFKVLRDYRFNGIFQFEGSALQSLCRQLQPTNFEDISALTALGRPGPLSSGGATEFIRRSTGRSKVTYLHPLVESITKVTYGVVIYQEQVMQIARVVGKLSWEDVSSLRKAMSKSLGIEFFDQYWKKFLKGAKEQNIKEDDAKLIWENINTMGSWSFNRSHAIAYAMVSYWCLVLKAHYPLEFAVACLRHSRHDDQVINILRELTQEGFPLVPFDVKLSQVNWTIQNNRLVGGLTAVKGIGVKKAEKIIELRNAGKPYPVGIARLLENAITPWNNIFEAQDRWGPLYEGNFDARKKHNIGYQTLIRYIRDILAEPHSEDWMRKDEYVFIGKIVSRNLRDHNEIGLIQKRGSKMTGQTQFLTLTMEDDTARMNGIIDRHHFPTVGQPIVDYGPVGTWYTFKGYFSNDLFIIIRAIRLGK